MKNKKWRIALSIICLLLTIGVFIVEITYHSDMLILIVLLYCIIIVALLFAEKMEQ